MAVLTVKPIHDPVRNSETPDEQTYVLGWRIRTNSEFDDATVVKAGLFAAFGVQLGAPLAQNVLAACVSIDPVQHAPKFWTCTATFSTKRELATNPLNDPPDIEWETQTFQKVVEKDIDGYAILNSAGDPYNPPPVAEFSSPVAIVRANTLATPSFLLSYRNVVNSDTFTIDGESVQPGYAMATRIRVTRGKVRNAQAFRKVSFALVLIEPDDPDGHQLSLLDAGFRALNEEAPPEPEVIENAEEPVLLDGMGAVLANPAPDGSNAIFNPYIIRRSAVFGGNLPGCI